MDTDKNGIPLDEAILRYRDVISFRVRRALGGWTPDWEDMIDEILFQAFKKVKTGEFRGEARSALSSTSSPAGASSTTSA